MDRKVGLCVSRAAARTMRTPYDALKPPLRVTASLSSPSACSTADPPATARRSLCVPVFCRSNYSPGDTEHSKAWCQLHHEPYESSRVGCPRLLHSGVMRRLHPHPLHGPEVPDVDNHRMIGPRRSFKVALDCWDSEAKGQIATEGSCRASARQRWRVDLATPRRFAPGRPEMPTDSSLPSGTGSDGRPRRFLCARARCKPATVRSFNRSRSKWLRAARIPSCSLPLANPRSRPSFNETK
jgi:hypothetical protein